MLETARKATVWTSFGLCAFYTSMVVAGPSVARPIYGRLHEALTTTELNKLPYFKQADEMFADASHQTDELLSAYHIAGGVTALVVGLVATILFSRNGHHTRGFSSNS